MANRLRKIEFHEKNNSSEILTGDDDIGLLEKKSEENKKNKFKNNNNKEDEKKNEPASSGSNTKENIFQKFFHFYHQPKIRILRGVFLIFFSVYLLVSMISYLYYFKEDFAILTLSFSQLISEDVQVNNIMGKTGGFIAHRLMFIGYGIFSFVWPVFFAFWASRQLRWIHTTRPAVYFLLHGVFIMLWGTLFLNMFPVLPTYISGNVGYQVKEVLVNITGPYGVGLILGFSGLSYGIWFLNVHKIPSAVKRWIDKGDANADVYGPDSPERNNKTKEYFSDTDNFASETNPEESGMDDVRMELHEILEENGIGIPRAEEKEDMNAAIPNTSQIPQKNNENNAGQNIQKEKNTPEENFEILDTTKKEENLVEENTAAHLVEKSGEFDPTLELSSYRFPGFDLLEEYGHLHGKVNEEEIVANKNRIVNTLKNYGIEIERITATVGPTVTLYEVVPAPGIRISKIKNLEDDIALSLSAMGIRIIAPIPGKGTVGIEVPNQNPEIVPMRNILASEKFNNCTYDLPICLGKTISNEIFIADLAKMPHLLIAGATGQGKSVGLNAILISLLYKKHPSQLKFVLVDPKKVELTLYNKIERHYLARLPNSEESIITDNTKVIHTLNSLCIEMDNRYALLQDAGARNIKEYNQKFVHRKLNPQHGHRYLPYIVLVVDEFADLIMTAGKEVEMPIARLAQLARAVGIHLIIATQRPSVNIITGVIKANFPARIAFRVSSKIDSRTILDTGGAEQLMGRGDMLLSTGNDLIRIQCAYVDTPEVERITDFIGQQQGYPSAFLLPEYVDENGNSQKEEVDLSSRDKMFEESARLVVQFQQGSVSFLQRKLKIGFGRAGRIVDQLEAAGIVGPSEGSKPREVLIKDMNHLEEILKKL